MKYENTSTVLSSPYVGQGDKYLPSVSRDDGPLLLLNLLFRT